MKLFNICSGGGADYGSGGLHSNTYLGGDAVSRMLLANYTFRSRPVVNTSNPIVVEVMLTVIQLITLVRYLIDTWKFIDLFVPLDCLLGGEVKKNLLNSLFAYWKSGGNSWIEFKQATIYSAIGTYIYSLVVFGNNRDY